MKEFMDLVTRLVAACENIARSLDNQPTIQRRMPEPKLKSPNGRPSNISDLSLVTPAVVEQVRAAQVSFAIDNMMVPWSEAHMRALLEYEKLVERDYGPGSAAQLPWRRVVPRGEDIQQ